MTGRDLSGNLWRYQAYQVLVVAFLFVPIVVLFWEENGLDPFDVYILQGLYAVAVVLLEVPTGMVADRLGKRTSLIGAAALLSAGMFVYAVGVGFVSFLLAEIVLAVGVSLLSGADSALLYDTLASLGREEDFRRVEGSARSQQMVSIAIFTAIGGLVGAWSFRATLWLSAIGPALALVIALGFVEAGTQAGAGSGNKRPSSLAESLRAYGKLIGGSVRFVRRHQLVRWHIAFLAVLGGSATWLLWMYQPYMREVGLPVMAFGLVFAGYNLFAALASRYAHRLDERFGRTGTLVALAVLQVVPLFGMALLISPAAILFVLGHQAVRGLSRPIIQDRVLRYTHADKRATVLSLGSLGARLFFGVTAPVIGWVTKTRTMSESLVFQGVLLIVALGCLMWAYGRIPAKYFVVKQSVRDKQAPNEEAPNEVPAESLEA